MKRPGIFTAITMILLLSVVLVSIHSCNKSNSKKAKQTAKSDIEALSSEGNLVIATISGSTITLSVNENDMLGDWEDFLDPITDFTGISLTASDIISDINGDYFLVAEGTVGPENVRSTIKLNYDGTGTSDLYLTDYTVSCTTKDCASEPNCVPHGSTCTPCSSEEDDCTKSVTESAFSMFPTL